MVYKGIDPEGKPALAVRVFTTEIARAARTLRPDPRYLKARRLKCLVDFEYRDRSIRSAGDGKWYPVILMEWVEGETLFHWVRGRAPGRRLRELAKRGPALAGSGQGVGRQLRSPTATCNTPT